MDIKALEQHLAQLVGAITAGGNIHGQLGGVQPHAVVAHILRQHLFQAEHTKHPGGVNLLAQLGRQAQRARQQLIALHHRLLARHVQAGDQAILRAGGSMHIEIFAEQMAVKIRVVDMNHAGLRKRRQHLVGGLRGVIRATLQRGGAQRRVKARAAIPGFVHNHLDAARMRRLDNRRQVITKTIIGARGQNQRLGLRMSIHRRQQRGLGHRAKNPVLPIDR